MLELSDQNFIRHMIENHINNVGSLDVAYKDLLNKPVSELTNDDIVSLIKLFKELQDKQFPDSKEFTLSDEGSKIYLSRLEGKVPSFLMTGIHNYIQNERMTTKDTKVFNTFAREYKNYSEAGQQNDPINLHNQEEAVLFIPSSSAEIEFYDKHFKTFAEQHNKDYVLNTDASHYQSQIINKNGDITHISAGNDNISIKSVSKEGKEQIPGYEYFESIAKLANEQDANISFGILVGDINHDEYKARLLIACLNADPQVPRSNNPNIRVSKLEPQTKAMLEVALANTNKHTLIEEANIKDIPENKELPHRNSDQADISIENLENKDFHEILKRSPKEQALKKQLKDSRQAYITKIENYKNITLQYIHELRYHLHHQKQEKHDSKNTYYQLLRADSLGTNGITTGWNLNIQLDPEEISQYGKSLNQYLKSIRAYNQVEQLTDINTDEVLVDYKIFIGSRDQAIQVLRDLQEIMPDKKLTEFDLHFSPAKFAESSNAPMLNVIRQDLEEEQIVIKQGIEYKILPENIEPTNQSTDARQNYLVDNLEAYASHQLYKKYAGTAYTGTDDNAKYLDDYFNSLVNPFLKEDFDKFARSYISNMENLYKNKDNSLLEEMKVIYRCKKLDFSKAKKPKIKEPKEKTEAIINNTVIASEARQSNLIIDPTSELAKEVETPQTNLSRQVRIAELENKSQLSPVETSELAYHQIAEQNSALSNKKQDYKELKVGKETKGWSVEFSFRSTGTNLENQFVDDINTYLNSSKAGYKQLKDDSDKDNSALRYKVYTGTYDNTKKLMGGLKKVFDDKLDADIINTSFAVESSAQDQTFMPNQYISLSEKAQTDLIKTAKDNLLLPQYTADTIDKNTDPQIQFKLASVQTYVSHKLYERHAGPAYTGKNPDSLNNTIQHNLGIPNDTLHLWDQVADKYIQKVEIEKPDVISNLKLLKRIPALETTKVQKNPPFPEKQIGD